jgi:uncharacterized damage-inducible protein DinB
MSATLQTLIETSAGYRSATVAALVASLDEQSRKLLEDVKELSVEDLGWQPAPGMNTMGMLLAHIAVAEAHLTEVGLLGKPDSDIAGMIGIPMEADGMPLPEGGAPPEALRGKDLAFFAGLLSRARAHLKQAAAPLTDADLDRQVARKRPDGNQRVFNLRWVLYHALEHEAGHHGQILLLRHMRKGPVR